MPSKKKKYNARFPAGRIKKIMQTDEEVGKVAQAVPIIISRTLELFVESLLTKSLEVTVRRNAKTLSPSHLKQCILSESRFDFLKDLVKNVPDISQNEDRESGQTWSTDSSPNTNRFNETSSGIQVNPGPSNVAKRGRPPLRKDNGQSSDSGSDPEPPAKIGPGFGNGRNNPKSNFDDELKALMNRMNRNKKATTPTQTKTNEFVTPTTPVSKENNDGQHRSLNFYAETLPDEDDDKEKSNHDSVIRPNPEYSANKNNQFGFYKPNDAAPPVAFATISITNTASDVNSKDIVPKFHIDLTKSFRPDKSEPFTPTLLLQPQTPALSDEQKVAYFPKPSSSPVNSNRFNFEASSSKKNSAGEPPMLLPISKNKSAVPQLKSSTIELDEDYDT